MKKSLFLFLTALLLPLCSAWATGGSTTYYSRLTVQRYGTGEGKIYASDGAATNPAYQTAAMTVEKSGTDQEQKYNIYAEAPTGTKFTGWTVTDGTLASTTDLATTVTITASSTDSNNPTTATVTANFEEETFASFSVTYAKPENGSISVDGTAVGASGLTTGPFTKAYTPTLVATPASGYAFDGWYATPAGGSRTLLSRSSTYTAAFDAATTVEAVFAKAVQVTTYEALVSSVAANVCTEIPAGTTITIPSTATLTVGSGKQLVVNGSIVLSGKIANSGIIGGSGTINLIKYEITQTGNGANPIVTETIRASDQKKYYKTTVATVSSSITGTAATCNLLNLAHVYRNNAVVAVTSWPSTDSPKALCFNVNSSVAVNHISGVYSTAYYTNVAQALGAMKGKGVSQMLVLLETASLAHTDCWDGGMMKQDGNYQKLDGNFGVIDLAEHSLTLTVKYINNYTHVVLNGQESVKKASGGNGILYGGNLTYINCSSVSIAIAKEDYASVINIYDCPLSSSKIIAAYNGSNEIKNAINFFSSSTSSYKVGDFLSKNDAYHIYGGTWTTKPADKFIASALASDYAFYPTAEGATTYSLQPKAGREVVEIDGGSSYESFEEAIAAALSSDSAKLTLLKSATLAKAITIPAGKTLEIELDGCCITAANGFAINHGTLILGDDKANLASTGGRIMTTSGNFIENDGTVEVSYGYYTGNVVLSGGTFTTHHGRFEGAFSGDKQYADLRGGYFAKDVSALLQDGYYRTNGYVGPFPQAALSKTWVSSNGGYWKYSFKTLPADDLTLYNNASNEKSAYTLANWKRRAELKSMIEQYPPASYMVDIAAGFDRDVAKGSASAAVTKPVSITQALPSDVAAGDLYRILSPYIVSQNSTQKKYSAFLSESTFQDTVFGFYSTADANKGTTANLRIDLCVGSNEAPTSKYALMSEYTVIGAGSNQAMIRPASGAATFYATIGAAVEAAKDGDTIMLCNDIESAATITVSKSCTIDTNGMVFKGKIVPGEWYQLAVSTTKLDVEKMLGKVHTTYTITKIDETAAEDVVVEVKNTTTDITPTAPQGGSVTIKDNDTTVEKIDISNYTEGSAKTYTIVEEKADGSITTSKLGVIAAKDAETGTTPSKVTTAVAVPFAGATVANLLNTALLNEGDTLMAYITVEGNSGYAMWTLTNGAWVGTAVNGGIAAQANTMPLARGTGVWVTTAGKIVTFGKYTTPTAVTPGEGTSLLGNINLNSDDVSDLVDGTNNGDQIIDPAVVAVPSVKVDGEWKYTEVDTTGAFPVSKKVKGAKVKVGHGFFYVRPNN